eukprot:5600204-Pyramimonas_sp.AAC.1
MSSPTLPTRHFLPSAHTICVLSTTRSALHAHHPTVHLHRQVARTPSDGASVPTGGAREFARIRSQAAVPQSRYREPPYKATPPPY